MSAEPSNAPRAPRGRPDAAYFRYAGAGLQFALTFLVFGALGWWADEKLDTTPWLMIVGIGVGAAGAMTSLVRRFGGPGATERAARGRGTDPRP